MSDEKPGRPNFPESTTDLSRREFVALSVAGLAVAATSMSAADLPVVEQNVEIKTADGMCDAAFIHPTSGSHPGVLIWPDAFGLRPAMRDIGKRLAAEGYSVLVPNPFYRIAKAPVFQDASSFSFQNQADMAKLQPLMGSVNAPGAAEKDAAAYIAFLDAQPQVNKAKKIGTQGYCMGGPLVVRTAAAVPGPRRRGRFVPWRRPGDRQTRQPAPARAENQSPDVLRRRVERRCAAAGREGQAARGVRGREGAGRDRSVSGSPARLVRPRHAAAERRADLQQARRRARVGQAPGALQDGARMILRQFYLNCLAHASYLVGDEETNTAAVVDPQRDIEQYLAAAAEHGLTIRTRVSHALSTPTSSPAISSFAIAPARAIYLGAAAQGGIRVHAACRRRQRRVRQRAARGARDAGPHARIDFDSRLRPRERSATSHTPC